MSLSYVNALDALPGELLVLIFSYLSAQPPSDIAACRLVNRTFKKHSSSFLIPRITFARRLDVITKFLEVLQHPYFCLHVTELVYDGSTYAEATAMNWNQYVDDCERAPRDLEDVTWAEQQHRDGIAWKELNSFRDCNYLMAYSSVATPPTKTSDVLSISYNKTFAEYGQRYANQEWIRTERIDRNLLAAALAGFPSLRSIVSTDYRSLARERESYDACCRRLFGKALEPQHVGVGTLGGQTTIAGDCLFSLLDVLAETPKARVDSLAIGPHAFEYTGEETSNTADPYHPQNPRYMDISALENVPLGSNSRLAQVLKRLRHLRLVLCYSGQSSDEGDMRGQVCRLLAAPAPRLQSLTLHMIYLFWGGVSEVPKVDNNTRFDVFNSIITPLRMPYLGSLNLRRWIFRAEELKAFLLVHATTLRDLHLLGCLCGDDEAVLAHWGSRHLTLTGIELSGFISVLDCQSSNPYGWKCVDQTKWKQMQPTVTEQEARNLESTWLAGRKNLVTRQQRHEILPENEWWKQPNSATI